MQNKFNVADNESFSDSIDESYTDYKSDDGFISMNAPEDIWGGNYVHPDIDARDDILKIHGCIRQAKIESEVETLSENRMVKVWVNYLRLL